MYPNREEIAKHYVQLSDEQLRHVALDEATDLRPEGIEALRDELQRRSLSVDMINLRKTPQDVQASKLPDHAMDATPNYASYTLVELFEAREWIDEQRYLEDVESLDRLIVEKSTAYVQRELLMDAVPNYTSYTLMGLLEARERIDEQGYPEHVEILDQLIAEKQDSGDTQPPLTLEGPAMADAPRKSSPFEFTGASGEYFKIWVVNVFLIILTLGIYSAWAKVRKKQYFYRNTFLLDSPFDYLADPKKILKGRLIVLGTLIILVVAGYVRPYLPLLLLVPAIWLFLWLVVKALTFKARNSSYRNIRFDFRGTKGEAARVFILQTIFTVLTFGFGYPYQRYRRTKFVFENGAYGTTPFRLGLSNSGPFYRVYLWQAAGVGILVAVATAIVLAIGRVLVPVAALPMFEQLISLLTGLTITAFLRAAGTNLVWSNVYLYGTTFTVYFQSTLSAPRMIWIYLSNALAIVCSLGLLIPWVSVRMVRYRLANLSVSSSVELDTFIASEQEKVGAVGEEIIDFFDFDIGL